MVNINPSIMVSDYFNTIDYIRNFEKVGIKQIHFDVMDGHFVDNIMLGTRDFDSIRKITDMPIDIHVMAYEPEKYIDMFNLDEGDRFAFHPETTNKTY